MTESLQGAPKILFHLSKLLAGAIDDRLHDFSPDNQLATTAAPIASFRFDMNFKKSVPFVSAYSVPMGGQGDHFYHPVSLPLLGECLLFWTLTGGGFNRSTQHPPLCSGTLEWHAYGGTCTDMVRAAAEGRALRALKERPIRANFA